MAAKRYKQIACYLRPDQIRGLRRYSKEHGVPVAWLLREAVGRYLRGVLT